MTPSGGDVALYCRISIDRSGRRESVDAQRRWGLSYAAAQWPGVPVRVFSDNDIGGSAGDEARPGLDELRGALRTGQIGHVWAVEQSRLTRAVNGDTSWFEIAAELDTAKIPELHTNRDGIVRVGDVVGGIKAVIYADEVRRLRRRVNDKLDEVAAQGRPSGATVFGYEHGRDDEGGKTLLVIPEQAAIIREIAAKVLNGWSLANITRELNARGVRGGHGSQLYSNSVRKIVTNPTVAGYRVHRGATVGRGIWEPILDQDTWTSVRLTLSQPRTVTRSDGGTHQIGAATLGSHSGRKYTLTGGLAVCGVCGHPMTGTVKTFTRPAVAKPYLLCSKAKGGGGCTGIMLEPVEAHVRDVLFDELDKPEFLDAVGKDDRAQRRAEIGMQVAALDSRRSDLAAMWAAGLTVQEWQAARSALDQQEQALRAELATLPPPASGMDITRVRATWPESTLDEQRQLLRTFIRTVTIHRAKPGTRVFDPDRVSIEWQ